MQTKKAVRLQIHSFMASATEVARVCALLATVPECALDGPHDPARGASFRDSHGRDTPAAVLLLVDADGLGTCCAAMCELHSRWPGVPLLALADCVDVDGLARLMACGIFDFGVLPSTEAEILMRVGRALGTIALPSDAEPAGLFAPPIAQSLSTRLIGRHPEFLRLLRRVPAMARSNACVLLLGETGTGKEVFAQAIHYESQRAQGPWVAVNCAAIPSELIEDELFGHARGAYTHAHLAREGLVREAEGGTLFLDEIDALSLAAQAKLLRFLEDKQYRVVGSSSLRSADVRILAASNHDLRLAAAKGSFRPDLFFRLNVLSLTLPPLRERQEDIPALALHFFNQAKSEAGRQLVGITPAALRRLLSHPWPGNVRELKHVMLRAVLMAEGQALQPDDIEIDGAKPVDESPLSFRDAKARAVESFERCYLEQLMLQNQGNISRAARVAQKNRRALFELLRRHEIDTARYRA